MSWWVWVGVALVGGVGANARFLVHTLVAARTGNSLPLPVLVINISVALLSTFIPVPGGIGVVEGGLLVGLTAVGMPESSAFAAILLRHRASVDAVPVSSLG